MRLALLLLATFCCTHAAAGEAKAPIYVNSKVSARSIALNQALRLEFTTMPRQIEGVDIATALTNSLALGSGAGWRVLGKPAVNEHEKTKTISVVLNLLPRSTGDVLLPQLPLTWLLGEQVAEFGSVKVQEAIIVAGEPRPLPRETAGVAGFAWGAKLDDLAKDRLAGVPQEKADGAVRLRPQPNTELVFRGGELCEASILAAGLGIEQARESFLDRWGMPHEERAGDDKNPARLTWILGWTRLSAEPASGGVRLSLLREDIRGRLDRGQVQRGLFDVLESPAAAASASAATPR